MNREEVIRMARIAGAHITSHGVTAWVGTGNTAFLERFAALVAAAEREACAKVCDGVNQKAYDEPDDWAPWEAADACAAAIRARGEA